MRLHLHLHLSPSTSTPTSTRRRGEDHRACDDVRHGPRQLSRPLVETGAKQRGPPLLHLLRTREARKAKRGGCARFSLVEERGRLLEPLIQDKRPIHDARTRARKTRTLKNTESHLQMNECAYSTNKLHFTSLHKKFLKLCLPSFLPSKHLFL